MTHHRTELIALLDRHGIDLRRALGQNFVADPNTVRRIARLAEVGDGDRVVEIGAGAGSLTLALLDTGAEVTAVEVDERLVPLLDEIAGARGARIVAGDARALDWGSLLGGAEPWTLVANLPYNIATPLVLDLLDDVPAIESMLVMVQREAGERLAARPATSAYGIPSVKVAYWAEAAIVGRVPASVFVPRPRVESALVRIRRRSAPAVEAPRSVVFELVRAAFGQRRKMLRRSLSAIAPLEAFATAGVDAASRPGELSIVDWGRLAEAVVVMRRGSPGGGGAVTGDR